LPTDSHGTSSVTVSVVVVIVSHSRADSSYHRLKKSEAMFFSCSALCCAAFFNSVTERSEMSENKSE
jgi:hypothetical protein